MSKFEDEFVYNTEWHLVVGPGTGPNSQSQPYKKGFHSQLQYPYTRDIHSHTDCDRSSVSSFSSQLTFRKTRESDEARKHFVDEHCWDLIRRIILVDPVLDDLFEENLLKEEEYDYLQGIPTSQKKMIELCDIVRAWDSSMKDQVYLALRQHNLPYIRVLEKTDLIMRQKWGSQFQKITLDLEAGSSVGKHFLDKHRCELIDNVSTVIPVLEELREEGLLTPEQYDQVLHKETPVEKMTEISGITNHYDNTMKDKFYLSLRRHNYSFIRNLERVDRQTRSERVSDTVQATESGRQEDAWFPGFIRFIITCVICMEMCHNPVTLSCGHNFCLDCIENTWDNQDKDDISCPLCKQRFKKRPELKRNIILSQIEELCQSSKSSKKSDGFCTYCLHDNVPVAKSCLLCQALLCGDHLTVHSKNGEHVLLEPSPSLEIRRCFIHNRVLEFYCVQDSLCICAFCCIMGEHKEHPVELAKDAMERKKIQLRDILENLTLKKEKIVKSIKVCRKAEQRNVSAARGAGDVVVQEIRDSLGAEVLGDMQEGQASASELIKHLEARRDELLLDIESMEELCYVTDPILLL
ncbi:uncharacterized protein LOC121007980 [Bufo bufo]|uniref:uncharacterized protein LOC121007980 n=1 Tax=Bufo bufo TaxID=8384 RepID=UPI001ABDA4B4|nr:uncharacterized protein LOC121007980 [Bufo bufo]